MGLLRRSQPLAGQLSLGEPAVCLWCSASFLV